MRLTCKMLKTILIDFKISNRIYKGHNSFNNRPEVRMDLRGIDKEAKTKIKKLLQSKNIYMYMDSPLELPFDYIVTF